MFCKQIQQVLINEQIPIIDDVRVQHLRAKEFFIMSTYKCILFFTI